ncbi:hypothetical protein TraAM80_04580 [Trypanosoma rangeli]|uniref:Uncharacterized protein n=1 Tax=Trypanosoma rangeli TaxID=5698 RepID=A0A3R7KF63_TRYRA|nr:uncharacterized protein TraAM80_04580 [Trypanosoma rangeli]RNF05289.1 hypothetical protein TraAM80_04580 [Trypanosoma rangeli]|eukprot:RNF05289.1 hypothetical protein TraAM80_04580 [Trypanosoma rangeli]
MWRRRAADVLDRSTRGVVSRVPAQPHPRSSNANGRCAASPRHPNRLQKSNPRPEPPQRRFSWRTSPPIVWFIANAVPIATYQLFLEAGCTGVCAWLLLHDRATVAGIEAWLHRHHYPLTGLINWEGGRHADDWTVAGCRIDAATLTALHIGHNIANGLLPLQVVFLAGTYPVVARVTTAVARGPLASQLMRAKERCKALFVKERVETPTCHPFGKPRRFRQR